MTSQLHIINHTNIITIKYHSVWCIASQLCLISFCFVSPLCRHLQVMSFEGSFVVLCLACGHYSCGWCNDCHSKDEVGNYYLYRTTSHFHLFVC